MKKIILTALTIIMISAPLFAEKMRIAVLNFKGTGVSQTTAENVSELIRGEMINTGLYLVVERARMDAILKEQGLQQTGCTDVECAVQVGKILSARKILVGTVMNIGGMIVISARVVDVETGTGEFSEKESAQSEKEILNAVTKFTKKLTDRISDGIPVYERSSEEEYKFKYDSWYLGMEYQLGQARYKRGNGLSSLIAMSACNSYGSTFHFGGRIGAIGIIGPSDEYKSNEVNGDNAGGYFGEISGGINLRIPSGWFGIKLYGGIGVFKGEMQTKVLIAEYDPFYGTDYVNNSKTVSYTAPVGSLSLEIPMSSYGSRFACPMVQVMILPTPEEVDEKYIVLFNFVAIKHVW